MQKRLYSQFSAFLSAATWQSIVKLLMLGKEGNRELDKGSLLRLESGESTAVKA